MDSTATCVFVWSFCEAPQACIVLVLEVELTQKWAMVLTSIVFSIRESGESMNFFPVTMPALFTRILTSPTSLFTWKHKETSHEWRISSHIRFLKFHFRSYVSFILTACGLFLVIIALNYFVIIFYAKRPPACWFAPSPFQTFRS